MLGIYCGRHGLCETTVVPDPLLLLSADFSWILQWATCKKDVDAVTCNRGIGFHKQNYRLSVMFFVGVLQGGQDLKFRAFSICWVHKSSYRVDSDRVLAMYWRRHGLQETSVVLDRHLLLAADFSKFLKWATSKYNIHAVTWIHGMDSFIIILRF